MYSRNWIWLHKFTSYVIKSLELRKVKFACDTFVWQLQVTNPLQVQNGSTVRNHQNNIETLSIAKNTI